MLGQSTKQTQSQGFTFRQIQQMQLLQLPVMELEARIKEELEKNPTLEEARPQEQSDPDGQSEETSEVGPEERNSEYDDDYFQQYMEDDPSAYNQRAGGDDDYVAPGSYTADETSFFEYLSEQLMRLDFESHQEILIGKQIVGNLDDDGYLARSLSAIADDLLINYHLDVRTAEIEHVLKIVQTLEPAGLAARDLRECLLLQLNAKIDDGEDLDIMRYADLILARTIVEEHYDLFTKKHYDKLREKLDVDEDELRDAVGEVLRLNPKPASGLIGSAGGRVAQTVVPDFILSIVDSKFKLQLTARNAPDLKINDHYQEMLANYRRKQKEEGKLTRAQKQAAGFIRQNIESATWFIDAIQQRQQTLFSVMHAILRYQDGYFRTGDTAMLRPMILKDIAEMTGLDISTISRVKNSKYIQTDFGTFALHEFFSEGMTNDDGEEVSTRQIKKKLAEIIENEDKRKPHSDGKLVTALKDAGYEVARRTVAKYRDQLGLPVARLRKEL